MDQRQMQIGEVAERTGPSVRTIRFYEESGLVSPTARSSGGFRLYTGSDVVRLHAIRRMKPLNVTIEEIREVMKILDGSADGPRRLAPERRTLTWWSGSPCTGSWPTSASPSRTPSGRQPRPSPPACTWRSSSFDAAADSDRERSGL